MEYGVLVGSLVLRSYLSVEFEVALLQNLLLTERVMFSYILRVVFSTMNSGVLVGSLG